MTEKIRKIRLLILDVDGVLTDGRIIYDTEGRELRFFDAQDGVGVRLLRAAGIKTIMITIKPCKAVEYRAMDMMVEEVYQGVSRKTDLLPQIFERHGVGTDEICYVGDDVGDLGMMRMVGFSAVVENGCPEARKAASYVTKKPGGRGAVREIAELILMKQGKWHDTFTS